MNLGDFAVESKSHQRVLVTSPSPKGRVRVWVVFSSCMWKFHMICCGPNFLSVPPSFWVPGSAPNNAVGHTVPTCQSKKLHSHKYQGVFYLLGPNVANVRLLLRLPIFLYINIICACFLSSFFFFLRVSPSAYLLVLAPLFSPLNRLILHKGRHIKTIWLATNIGYNYKFSWDSNGAVSL